MNIPRRVLALTCIAAIAATGVFLAHGPLLQVRSASVTGYTGPDAPRVHAAFAQLAKTGTVLRGAEDDIRSYAKMIPAISAVDIEDAGMFATRIRLVTRPAVAVVHGMGAPRAMAADGTVVPAARGLATVSAGDATAAQRRQLLAVAAALPARARGSVRALQVHRGVMRARLANGTPVRLGEPHAGRAKGAALGRVLLALPGRVSESAYIDVSVPRRVVLGARP